MRFTFLSFFSRLFRIALRTRMYLCSKRHYCSFQEKKLVTTWSAALTRGSGFLIPVSRACLKKTRAVTLLTINQSEHLWRRRDDIQASEMQKYFQQRFPIWTMMLLFEHAVNFVKMCEAVQAWELDALCVIRLQTIIQWQLVFRWHTIFPQSVSFLIVICCYSALPHIFSFSGMHIVLPQWPSSSVTLFCQW